MKVSQLATEDLRKMMATDGININLGIASFNIVCPLAKVADNFYQLYANHSLVEPDQGIDFHIKIKPSSSLRRWFWPQVEFVCDQHRPFLPLPTSQAYPFLEWGMNYCIAAHCHNYLLLHAAVLAKGDKAIVLPAPPGSGKSTLTCYLAHTGWRLLSDEMAVINIDTNEVTPFIRPICLKNDAIDIVKTWFNNAVISDVAKDTKKGDVAHVRPPSQHLDTMYDTARIVGIVFPTYDSETDIAVEPLTKCDTFLETVDNDFNANVLASEGFNALTSIVEQADGFKVRYSDMQSMVSFLQQVIDSHE